MFIINDIIFAFFDLLSGRCPVLLLILSEFKRFNFCSPRNYQKIYRFLMISGVIEVNQFA